MPCRESKRQAIIVVIVFCVQMNACGTESETWDRQVDGSLHYMYIPIANIIRGSMTVGHENLNITF